MRGSVPSILNISDRHDLCYIQANQIKMIQRSFLPILFVLLTVGLCSCSAIGDIFEAGVWSGIIVVVLVVALIGFLINKMRR